MKTFMQNSSKVELEKHLLRIKDTIDCWTLAERRIGSEKFKIQLLEMGIPIDKEASKVIEKFNNGAIGFNELSEFFKDKII